MSVNLKRVKVLLAAWADGSARPSDIVELREALPTVIDDAAAWQKGVSVLAELQARVIPCGHTIGDLVGGSGAVTKCGACLAARTAEVGASAGGA